MAQVTWDPSIVKGMAKVPATTQSQPSTTSGPPPAYSDIWNYDPARYRINYGANSGYGSMDQSKNPYSFSGDPTSTGGHMEQQGGGEGGSKDVWVPDPVQVTKNDNLIPDKYKNLYQDYGRYDNTIQQWISNKDKPENNGQNQFKYDLSSLPNKGLTKFKSPDGTQVDIIGTTSLGTGDKPDTSKFDKPGGMKMKNPNLVYFDENYGWITPNYNLVENPTGMDKLSELMPQIAVGALGMGAGALAGPAWALGSGAVNMARGLGDGGDWKQGLLNAAPGMIGAGLNLGGFQIPPAVAEMLKYGKIGLGAYDAFKNKSPMQLAALASGQLLRGGSSLFGGG